LQRLKERTSKLSIVAHFQTIRYCESQHPVSCLKGGVLVIFHTTAITARASTYTRLKTSLLS